MKYPYIVNKDGVWYPAGAEVPADSIPKDITKTDINRMPVGELRKMALEHGIDDVENMSGADIKKYLIEILEL